MTDRLSITHHKRRGAVLFTGNHVTVGLKDTSSHSWGDIGDGEDEFASGGVFKFFENLVSCFFSGPDGVKVLKTAIQKGGVVLVSSLRKFPRSGARDIDDPKHFFHNRIRH